MSLIHGQSSNSFINSFAQNNILTKADHTKKDCNILRLSRAAAVILGLSGRIPFIRIAQKATTNVAYGWALAGINATSFGVLFSWSMLKMVNDFTEKISSEEARLLSRKQNSSFKSIVFIASVFVGILSLLPQAYFAYVYNKKNFIYPAALLICDSGLPSLSIKMTFDKLFSPKETDQFVLQTRSKLINLVEQLQEQMIANMSSETSELKKMVLKEGRTVGDQSVYQLFEVSMENSHKVNTHSTLSCKKITTLTAQGTASLVGAVLVVAQLALFFVASVKFMDMVKAGKVSGYILGTAVALINAHLFFNILVLGPMNLAKRGVNLVTCQAAPSLIEKINAGVFYILMTIGTVFACFSYGPTKTFAEDYFGEYEVGNLNVGDAMEVILPAGVAMLIINAMGDIIGDIIKGIASKKGTQSTKDLIYLDAKLDRLKRLFAEAPFYHVAKFLLLAPDSIIRKLGEEPSSFRENLQKYINEESTPLVLNEL